MQCGYAAGGLRAWAAKRISATLSTVRPPQLALERMVIRNGDLWATLTGEAIPRHIQNVNLQLKLGRDYRTLTLDITGVLDLHLYPIKQTAGFTLSSLQLVRLWAPALLFVKDVHVLGFYLDKLHQYPVPESGCGQ